MIERILTVGGFTLLSRVTGFLRDIMLAAILGACQCAYGVSHPRSIVSEIPAQRNRYLS